MESLSALKTKGWERKGYEMAQFSCTSEPYDRAVGHLCPNMQEPLRKLPDAIRKSASEIRLRAGRPVAVTVKDGVFFIQRDGKVCRTATGGNLLLATPKDLEESFHILCDYSVHSHQNEIRSGFLPLPGGHRAGICGTAVYANGIFSGLRDISSINLRIAREIIGAAGPLLRRMDFSQSGGILLAGPPSSGKTTILRDLARQLSTGTATRRPFRVVIVDERGELAGTYQGLNQNDIGTCCDVLDGYDKAEGILQAIRGLSPQVIICDELGGPRDYESVRSGVNAGVRMIASVHAGDAREAAENGRIRALLETGAFSHLAVLRGMEQVGELEGIYQVRDWHGQNHRANFGRPDGDGGGIPGIQKAV